MSYLKETWFWRKGEDFSSSSTLLFLWDSQESMYFKYLCRNWSDSLGTDPKNTITIFKARKANPTTKPSAVD